MKKNYIFRSLLGIVSLMLSVSFSGCIKEDLAECPQDLPRVRVIPNALPGSILPDDSDIKTVRIYVFDESKQFIGTVENAAVNEWITLDYPQTGPLYVVAVANMNNDSENAPVYEIGDPVGNSAITIINTGMNDGRKVYCSPGDLFKGNTQVENHRTDPEERDLPITRITSQTNIEIKGMKKHYGLNCDNLTVIVQNQYNAVNLSREYSGHTDNTPVLHMPAGSFKSSDLHHTPTFHMVSGDSGQAITLEVYDGDTLIETFTHDYNGDPFVAVNGRLLEIRISYVGNVVVVIQDYGEWIVGEPIEEEF